MAWGPGGQDRINQRQAELAGEAVREEVKIPDSHYRNRADSRYPRRGFILRLVIVMLVVVLIVILWFATR